MIRATIRHVKRCKDCQAYWYRAAHVPCRYVRLLAWLRTPNRFYWSRIFW